MPPFIGVQEEYLYNVRLYYYKKSSIITTTQYKDR